MGWRGGELCQALQALPGGIGALAQPPGAQPDGLNRAGQPAWQHELPAGPNTAQHGGL